jgi:hypothetical protein
MQIRAAAVLAAIYVFCVLAPVAAFGFGDGSRAAHCFTDDNHAFRAGHVHEPNVHKHNVGKELVHEDSTSHESKERDGKSSDRQCCGLICLSALPADVFDVQTPTLPAMVAGSVPQEDVAGKAPERLYRPPISPLSL